MAEAGPVDRERCSRTAPLNVLLRYVTLSRAIQIFLASNMHRIPPFVVALLLLVGCGSHRHREAPAYTGPREVTIQWLGHGCFRVTSSIGLTVLTDPFNPLTLNYPVKTGSVAADVVLVTHEDDTANDTDLAAGSPIIFRSSMASGVNRASGILVRGVRTSSESLSANAKLNVAYTWAMDGIRFCDLGAVEDTISPSEALQIGRVDVLFLPVGGPADFTEDKRRATVDRLQPRVIVPMMYSTAYSSKVPLRGLGDWLSRQRNVIRIRGNSFTLVAAQLPTTTTVYVPSVP
jgi:L-ascorbate metabolism protein UlaG (beta-lactamase superfamily)